MLVAALGRQKCPEFERQSDWMEVIFMDDCSTDSTVATLRRELGQLSDITHVQVVQNTCNIGLSATLNKAITLAQAPIILTCHCDCEFGSDSYVSQMIELMENHPSAGAIAGQSAIPEARSISMIEKFNLIANLQDIFPSSEQGLLPVGFAEGRCDAFRKEVLVKSGCYDQRLRLAGEDQILAAMFRALGFEVYIAPSQKFYISVSENQNTLPKLISHAGLYGRVAPSILFHSSEARQGIFGKKSGENRFRRGLLRLNHLISSFAYVMSALLIPTGTTLAAKTLPLLAIVLMKLYLFLPHMRAIRLNFAELALFVAVQPLMDLSYSAGFAQGLVFRIFLGKNSRIN